MRGLVFLFAGACGTGAMLPPLAPGPLRVSAPAHASRAAVGAHLAFAEHFEDDPSVMEDLGERIEWECQALSTRRQEELEGGSP